MYNNGTLPPFPPSFFPADVATAALDIIQRGIKDPTIKKPGKLDPERLQFFEALKKQVIKFKKGNKKNTNLQKQSDKILESLADIGVQVHPIVTIWKKNLSKGDLKELKIHERSSEIRGHIKDAVDNDPENPLTAKATLQIINHCLLQYTPKEIKEGFHHPHSIIENVDIL